MLGAGIAGCVASLRLAAAGARVVTLEARAPGGGATGRSAGFLIRGTANHPDRAAAALGAERALAVWDYVEQSLEGLLALLGEDSAACGVRCDGGLVLATDAQEADSLAKSIALLAGRRNAGALWPAAEVERRTGFAGFSAGWFRPGDGMVEPAALCHVLAARAEALGVTLVSGVRAERIDEPPRGPLTIHTDRGTLVAEQALLAVNAALPALAPPLSTAVTPVRAQMHSTAPVTGVPRLPWPVYAHHGYEYWRQQADGALLFGGCRLAAGPAAERGVTDDAAISEPVFIAQRAFLARHLPAFAHAPVATRWSGIMAFTPDGLPLVGRLPGSARQWVCAACNGHGLALSPRSADVVAAAMLDATRERELPVMFAPSRVGLTAAPGA